MAGQQSVNNPFFYSMLMFIAGIGIPVMATFTAVLGDRLHSPVLAVVIMMLVGLILAVGVLLVSGGLSGLARPPADWHLYAGSALFIFYLLSASWVIPRFGVANAIAFVLIGQLCAMVLIDHFALFGLEQYSLTLKRALGLLLMGIGVFLVVGRS